jgi:hypothetical protein
MRVKDRQQQNGLERITFSPIAKSAMDGAAKVYRPVKTHVPESGTWGTQRSGWRESD